MWISVRTMDGKKTVQIDGLSKLTKIESLKDRLTKEFDVSRDRQRLFFNGKQLEDDHTLFEYNVGLNALVQLMVRPLLTNGISAHISNGQDSSLSKDPTETTKIQPTEATKTEPKESAASDKPSSSNGETNGDDRKYQVDDLVDAKDLSIGAWFEAKIVNITSEDVNGNKSTIYHVLFDGYDETDVPRLEEKNIRPRARRVIPWSNLHEGQTVMANYNVDEPKERGFWYDVKISRKVEKRNKNLLFGKLLLSGDEAAASECEIHFTDEVFAVESLESSKCSGQEDIPEKRKVKPDCAYCKDDPLIICKECACHKCGGKDQPDKQIMCDECDMAFHIGCLEPPLESIPDDEEWYCPLCRNDPTQIVQAGDKLKASKKKLKMASANSPTTRDWGKGMACVGRTKVCTLVPPNHFGPIPGVPVGSLWKFRLQVSEAGIHRPHVSGIHGRESDGAYSIVLAGGYEDDTDKGTSFVYTGSGGRDLSGNKRTAEQSCDQKLTKMNRALAKNCDAPLDEKKGADAKNWKDGKPVRVVRSAKFKKHSKFAPDEGNRYDGIYKVTKYWPEKGKSGFIVWRYKFQRDDETPPPWTKEGKKLTDERGLVIQYPPGYLEAQAKKENKKSMESDAGNAKENGRKRVHSESPSPVSKRTKMEYSLPQELTETIMEDKANSKIWSLLTTAVESYQKFLTSVEEQFTCICCQDVVYNPITTECSHNLCKACLLRAFKAKVEGCPVCRNAIPKEERLEINKNLHVILTKLFPGYEVGR